MDRDLCLSCFAVLAHILCSCQRIPAEVSVEASQNVPTDVHPAEVLPTLEVVNENEKLRRDVAEAWRDHLQGKWRFFGAEYSTTPGWGPKNYTFEGSRLTIEYKREFETKLAIYVFDVDVSNSPVSLIIRGEEDENRESVQLKLELRAGDLWVGPNGFRRVDY